MREEGRDNSIYVIGILAAFALIFYGLWTEGHPTVVEIVELVSNRSIELLDPKVMTRVDKEMINLTATPGTSVGEVIYMTATPAVSVNELIYGTPVTNNTLAAVANDSGLTEAEKEIVIRALTPVAPTPEPSPTWTLVPPQAPSTMPPIPVELLAPTQAPAPPTQAPAPPTQTPPTQAPEPPTQVPPTQVPPTQVPPTQVPPTQVPPTQVPPTQVPPTQVPPTQVPPTQIPPTQVPPTAPPQPTLAPTASPELIAPDLLNSQDGNTELAAALGSATLQGNIKGSEGGELTMILTNGDYYQAMVVGFGVYPKSAFNRRLIGACLLY